MTYSELTDICTFHISLASLNRTLTRKLQLEFSNYEIVKLTIKDHKVIAFFNELENVDNKIPCFPSFITVNDLFKILDNNIFVKISIDFIINPNNIIHKIFYNNKDETFEIY